MKTVDCDCVVIGGGMVGAATALTLARARLNELLLIEQLRSTKDFEQIASDRSYVFLQSH